MKLSDLVWLARHWAIWSMEKLLY